MKKNADSGGVEEVENPPVSFGEICEIFLLISMGNLLFFPFILPVLNTAIIIGLIRNSDNPLFYGVFYVVCWLAFSVFETIMEVNAPDDRKLFRTLTSRRKD